VDATTRSLLDQLPTLTPARRKALTDDLLGLLTRKKDPVTGATEAAAVRLLATLDDPKAAAAFWDRAVAPHPPELRAAALHALARWVPAPARTSSAGCSTAPPTRTSASPARP
jgi:hypothetical protein